MSTPDGLLEDWLAGRLDDAGCADLLAEVEADPGLARRMAEDARVDLLLAAAHGRRPDLRAAVLAGLRGPDSRSRLRQVVMRDLPGRPRRVWGPRWWLAAAALVAILLAGWWMLRDPAVGRVMDAPPGWVVVRDGRAIPAVSGTRLRPGDLLEAGPGVLRLAAGRVRLGLAGRLTVQSADVLALAAGSIEAEVDQDPAAQPVRITTPQADALVVGTAFTLTATEERTSLSVAHGLVRFTGRAGPAVDVGGGRSAEAHVGAAAELQPRMEAWFRPGLDGWRILSGTWTVVDGQVIGGEEAGHSRLMSRDGHGDLDIDAWIRVAGAPFAEFQIADYAWFVHIPACEGWARFQVRVRGSQRSCRIDGQPVGWEPGFDGATATRGPVSFYIRSGGRIEIRDARIGVP